MPGQTQNISTVIRIGDRFTDGKNDWEVIDTYPGGKVDLFDRAKTRFQMRYHREVKTWQRLSQATPEAS